MLCGCLSLVGPMGFSTCLFSPPLPWSAATEVVTVFVFQEPSLLSSLQDNGLTDVMLHALLIKDVSPPALCSSFLSLSPSGFSDGSLSLSCPLLNKFFHAFYFPWSLIQHSQMSCLSQASRCPASLSSHHSPHSGSSCPHSPVSTFALFRLYVFLLLMLRAPLGP